VADLGAYRPREQTGRRPVVIWQSDTLTRALQSVLVVPLTTNLDRARLAGTAMIEARERFESDVRSSGLSDPSRSERYP
jgi:mRNA-degrading endonuclease toxin of MazEF toxin-antitoxin module